MNISIFPSTIHLLTVLCIGTAGLPAQASERGRQEHQSVDSAGKTGSRRDVDDGWGPFVGPSKRYEKNPVIKLDGWTTVRRTGRRPVGAEYGIGLAFAEDSKPEDKKQR